MGRESILLKEGEEKHFELKICYERNEIGQLEGKTCFVSRINNYEIEPSYQKLEECKEEYIYIGGGTNKLQYNNLVNKKRQPFNKEEEKVTYANSGQIVEIRDQENKIKKEYEYNYLAGTLKQEYNKEIGQVITYGYEDVNNFGGNLLRKKKYNLNYELEEDIEYLYEMPYIDLLKGIKVNNETKTFIYDEGLNLIQYADKKLKWKRGRLLESIEDKETKIEYQYDSNNIRVEKKEIKKAEITKYEVEGTRIISETKIKNNEEEYRIKYLYTEAEIIGFEIEQKNIRSYYIYEKDSEHNIVGLYEMNDYCGTRVASYIYDAYGNHKVLDKNKEENKAKNFIGNMNPIRYKGYYYDIETNLFLITSRYYSPKLGRFIQPADVSSLKPSSINGLNLYSYANNNPIGIAYSSSGASFGAGGGMVSSLSLGGLFSVGNNLGYSNSFNIFAGLNWSQLNVKDLVKDTFISLGEVGYRIAWGLTKNGRAFLDFHYSGYGINGYTALDNLPSTSAKIFKGIGIGLMALDVIEAGYYSYQNGHSFGQGALNVGLTAGKNILVYKASTGVATAVGTWAGAKLGASLGSAAGPVGFTIGAVAGAVVGCMQAVHLLEQCGLPPEHLTQEKTEVYNQLAELNRQIRAERKKLDLCREIQTASKQMEEDIRKTKTRGKEVEHDEHRRR